VNAADEPTSLYRQYDADGELLYVGISRSVSRRTLDHLNYACWASDIATIKVEHFKTKYEALEAEAAAVECENPKHNKIYWPGAAEDKQAKAEVRALAIDTDDVEYIVSRIDCNLHITVRQLAIVGQWSLSKIYNDIRENRLAVERESGRVFVRGDSARTYLKLPPRREGRAP